jgi:hypothetical protein
MPRSWAGELEPSGIFQMRTRDHDKAGASVLLYGNRSMCQTDMGIPEDKVCARVFVEGALPEILFPDEV